MKLLKTSFTALLLSLFMVGVVSEAVAQDRRAAVKAYNKAREMVQSGDFQQAINLYNQAMTTAESIENGDDIVKRVKNNLPQVYQQMALSKYKAFQKDQSLESLDATIDAFRETKDIATEFGVSQTAQKADGIITQLLYNKSLFYFKNQEFETSLATLNDVIDRDATYSKAYYQKGIVTKKMSPDSLEQAISYFEKAIEIGQEQNDSQIVSNARSSVHSELVYRGSKAIENKNFDQALDYLQRSLEYDTGSDAHFRLAQVYNNTQEWQQAVTHSEKALGLESGGKTDKAKIYFELATAFQGMGKKDAACSAYGNAAYGQFKSNAEHQMKFELECESATE
jgi:tetratricopeptide (TPR) repeat protein